MRYRHIVLLFCLCTAAVADPDTIRLPDDTVYSVQQDVFSGQACSANERLRVVAQYNWFVMAFSRAELEFGSGAYFEDPQDDTGIGVEDPVDAWYEAVESVANSGDVLATAEKVGQWDTRGSYYHGYELKVNGGPMDFHTSGFDQKNSRITIIDPNGGDDHLAAPPPVNLTATPAS